LGHIEGIAMQKKRAFVTTALLGTAAGLFGCTVSTGEAMSGTPQLPAYQQTLVGQANRHAVQSVSHLPPNTQLAAVLQTGTRTDVPSGILQPGSIILRRSEAVERPIPAEELAATVRRIAMEAGTEAATRQVREERPIILAAAEDRINATASELSRQTNETIEQTAARLQAESMQRNEEVANAVKAYAEKNTAATAEELRAYAQEIADKTARLQQDLTEAEKRQKSFVVNELAFREQTTEQKFAHLTERQELLAAAAKDYARAEALAAQLAAQNTTIQQVGDVSRNVQATAQQVESRSRDYTADKIALASTENKLATQQLAATLSTQLAAVSAETKLAAQQVDARLSATSADLSAKLAATSTENKLANQQLASDVSGKLAAASAQSRLEAQQTATELKDIRAAQTAQQQMLQQTITQVAAELRTYGDAQIASLAHETRNSISQTAAVAQQSTDDLTAQTSAKLAQMRAEAANRSELLATRLSNQFAENLNTLATETEAKRLTPEQVANAASAAADTAVTGAMPQFRALALQTLADSQDYIRTVAQESLTDGSDPAVQEALQNAAKNVITKDDEVVFAIREALTPKAVAPILPEGERTVLGDGQRPNTITADVDIDATRLGVAALAGVKPASGPSHLAKLNPGASSAGIPRHRQDWIDLRKYRVVVHEDAATLESLMSRLMAEAVPYTGPWQIKWKLRPENADLMKETFSLDAETTFEEFVTYLSQYVHNARGVKLGFNLFDAEHILVISD
jgi:hypothetical protein